MKIILNNRILLLNASNFESELTYPYAFIQVSEIASRFNIQVICRELFGIPEEKLESYFINLLNNERFDLIGITIRNVDSCDYLDYFSLDDKISSDEINFKNKYLPILNTKIVIRILRRISKLPIIIGGFAFSIMPRKLMNYLKPDFGVFGGPDDIFEHFNELINQQNLQTIQNLFYFEQNILKAGPMKFFPPTSKKFKSFPGVSKT